MRSLITLFCLPLFVGIALCPATPAAAVVLAADADAARSAAKVGGNFDVAHDKDVAYYDGADADKVKHRLDLYLPKDQKDFPVLIYVHGGTWQRGDKKELLDPYGRIGRTFARNGIGLVVTNYRLSPKVQHPAHVQDVAKAFAWVHDNIAKYGGNPKEIFLIGHSAGGHLVALLATDSRFLKAEKKDLGDIRGVIGMSGVYRIPPKMFEDVFGKDEKAAKNAGPIENVNGKHPPFLLLFADKDLETLDRMARDFAAELEKHKSEAAVKEIKGRDHFTIMLRMPKEEDETTQTIFEFIAKHSNLKLTPKDAANAP